MPDANGRIKGISIPNVPWHDRTPEPPADLTPKMLRDFYETGFLSPEKPVCPHGTYSPKACKRCSS